MSTRRSVGLFVLLSIFWGTAFVAIKAGLAYVPPVLFAGLRYDVAGLLMVGYAAATSDYWRPRTRADWLTILVGATLVIALYNALLFVGEQGVTSGVAAILVATNPILATAFAAVLLPDERLRPVGVLGLVVGFLGVGLVASPEPSNLLSSEIVAPAFVLGAAACTALGSVLVQRLDGGISTEGTVAWSTALGAVVLHALSAGVAGESPADATLTVEALAAIGYLAVFASAVGYFVYFDLLDRLGAIEINLVSYAAPVFAAVVGWALLGEVLAPTTVVGFLAIFAGFLLLKREAIRAEVGRLLSPARTGPGD